MRKTFFGSQESYPISITADGFSMSANAWSVRCIVGAKSTECPKFSDVGGKWYFALDTSKLAVGICICVVEYDVPDVNYEGGVRHEVYKENLVKIESYERV